jgi:hypothetical protein
LELFTSSEQAITKAKRRFLPSERSSSLKIDKVGSIFIFYEVTLLTRISYGNQYSALVGHQEYQHR